MIFWSFYISVPNCRYWVHISILKWMPLTPTQRNKHCIPQWSTLKRISGHHHKLGNYIALGMEHWKRGQPQTTLGSEQGLLQQIACIFCSLQELPSPLLPQCKLTGPPASPRAICTCQSSTLTILKPQALPVYLVTLSFPPLRCTTPQEASRCASPLYLDIAE